MSNEAEQSVLGALLNKNECLDLISLTTDHFTSLDHKIIYKGILDLYQQGIAFDCITLGEMLTKTGYDNVGIFSYLVELQNNIPSTQNIVSYAKIVKRDYLNKKLKMAGHNIQMIAEEGGDFDKNLESALNLFDALKVEDEKDIITISEHVDNYMAHLENLMELKGLDGLETGFKDIDARLNGLKNGELIIIGGRPASGKSAYALNIANHVAKEHPVIFFSMEMPWKQVVQRSVSSIGKVDMNWLKGGLRYDESQWATAVNGMTLLKGSGLIIDDNGTQTIQSIRIKCKKQKGLKLVIVDYLQLMTGIGGNRTEQIGSLSRGLKKLAKELDCPVIALSQLNRGVESRKNKRPLMSDLRESGDIEADADIIQFIYRDEYYHNDYEHNKGFAEIGTAKFRDGEVGTDFLQTEMHRSLFKDVDVFTYQPFQGAE